MTHRCAPRRGGAVAAACAAALALASPAAAQTQVPTGVDPARLPRQAPAPVPAPAAPPPETTVPTAPTQGPPPGAENLRFTLTALRIDGVSAYAPEALRPLYEAMLGREISVADLYAIAEVITERYRVDGYLISRALVPAQRIDNGIARLQVVEGFIAEVQLQSQSQPQGQTAPDATLQARAERAVIGRQPLTLRALERSLLLLNDLPGVTAQGLIEPAPAGPLGAARLAVTAESGRAWDGYIAADNRGSRYVGPWQITAGGAVSSVVRAYDRLVFRAVGASPLKELRFGEIGYETPIGANGWMIAASAFASRSEPGFTLTSADARGESEGFSLGVSYPIIRTRAENLRVSLAFTPYNSRNDLFGRRDVTPGYQDNMRPLRAALAYDRADGWGGLNAATIELSQGLNLFGASPEGRANASRTEAQTDFTRVVAEASRLQDLGFAFAGLGVLGALRAQWAFGNPLVAAEQFGVGGARFGRGYDPSEIAGDNGLAGTIELQWTTTIAPAGWTLSRPATLQPYAFWDAGVVTNAKGADVPSSSLASAGAGVRLWLGQGFAAALEIAKPLTRDVAAERLAGKDGRNPRVFVSSVVRF